MQLYLSAMLLKKTPQLSTLKAQPYFTIKQAQYLFFFKQSLSSTCIFTFIDIFKKEDFFSVVDHL